MRAASLFWLTSCFTEFWYYLGQYHSCMKVCISSVSCTSGYWSTSQRTAQHDQQLCSHDTLSWILSHLPHRPPLSPSTNLSRDLQWHYLPSLAFVSCSYRDNITYLNCWSCIKLPVPFVMRLFVPCCDFFPVVFCWFFCFFCFFKDIFLFLSLLRWVIRHEACIPQFCDGATRCSAVASRLRPSLLRGHRSVRDRRNNEVWSCLGFFLVFCFFFSTLWFDNLIQVLFRGFERGWTDHLYSHVHKTNPGICSQHVW